MSDDNCETVSGRLNGISLAPGRPDMVDLSVDGRIVSLNTTDPDADITVNGEAATLAELLAFVVVVRAVHANVWPRTDRYGSATRAQFFE